MRVNWYAALHERELVAPACNNLSLPFKKVKSIKLAKRYYRFMTAVIVIVAVTGLFALLGAAILIPYLSAMATGRALAWVFQVESDQAAREVDALLSPERFAEIDALMTSSQRMARDAQRRADAWPAAR